MTRSRLEQLAPLTGVAFVVLFVVSFIILGETPDVEDSADDVVTFWQDNEAEGIWSALFGIWGVVLAVWFAASVRTALRVMEGGVGRLSSLAFAGWIIFAVGMLAFIGFQFAVADVADEETVGPEVIQTLSILNSDFFPIVSAGLALAMIATAVATLRFGGLPRWLGYLAAVIGIASVTPIGFFSFLAAGIWVLIVSVLLYRTVPVVVATPPVAGPPPPGPPPAV